MFVKTNLIVLSLSLVLGACGKTISSKDVGETPVHIDYVVSYDEGYQFLSRFAQAKAGGATVRFSAPAGFYVDKTALELAGSQKPVPEPAAGAPKQKVLTNEELAKELQKPELRDALADAFEGVFSSLGDVRRWGTFYERYGRVEAMQPQYEFVYVSEKGVREVTAVVMPQPVKPIMEKNSYRAGEAFNITWEGAANTKEEQLVAQLRVFTDDKAETLLMASDAVPAQAGKMRDVSKEIEALAKGKKVQAISLKFGRVRKEKTGSELKTVTSEFISKSARLDLSPKK